MKQQQKWVVGVRFDDQVEHLLSYVASLQSLTSAMVHLTHAIEPWGNDAWLSTYVGADLYAAVAKDAELQTYKDSEQKLKQLRLALRDDSTKMHTITGPAYKVLTEVASDEQAAGVIVGIGERSDYRFLPRGFSTAISLMADCKIPCLAVPRSRLQFRQGQTLNVAILDDLRPESIAFLSHSQEFLKRFGAVNFHHVHVAETHKGEWTKLIEITRKLIKTGGHSIPDEFSVEDLHKPETGRKILTMRAEEAGVTGDSYHASPLVGEAIPALQNYCNEQQIDLLVVGPHKRLHKKPYGIGRFSLAMLSGLQCPLLTLPLA